MSQGDYDIAVADGKRTTTSTALSSPSNFTIDTDVKAANDLSSDPPVIKSSSWKDLFAFTKFSHAGPLLAALMSSAITACFKVALAVVLGQVFDLIGEFGNGTRSGHSTMIHVARWTLIIFGLGIGNWIAHSAFLALWIMFGELQASSVREDTFHSLLSKDMSWFDSQDQGVSSLLVRIQTQTRELQLATSQILGLLVCDIVAAFASIGVAFYFSWKITLVLLATLPVAGIILSLASRPCEPAIQRQRAHLATASKLATASLLGIDLVKVFGGYKTDLRHYTDAIHRSSKPFHVQAACNSFQMGFVVFWVFGLFVIGFWFGLSLVEEGMSPGNVLTTFYATLAAFQGFESLMPHWLVLAKGMSAGGFLAAIVSDSRRGEKKIWKMGRTARPTVVFGDIKLTNVSFAYPSNPKNLVLSRSTLSFAAGKITFIVGRSGSGKSTIGNLIANLYEPTTGDIYVDGNPMRILNEQWIRENITLVQQSSVLFSDTLFNNIAFGHPYPERATPGDVLLACTSAMLQSTLSILPHGLETQIGLDGHDLSGGQKQRLALARARLRDPPVLILDEVTSGLDPVTRTLVMHSIRRWRQNKTTIIITHDLSQIDGDDYVYVMDSSYLVEQGLKRDLGLEYGGFFSQLVARTVSELAANHRTVAPVPESPEDISPVTPVIRSRGVRVTDYLMQELESNTQRLSASRHAYRLSLTLTLNSNPDLRKTIRESQRQVFDESPVLPMMRPVSFRPGGYDTWDEEINRFSSFVSHHFSLQPDNHCRFDDPDEIIPLTRRGTSDKSKLKSSGIPSTLMVRAATLRNKIRSRGPSLRVPSSLHKSSAAPSCHGSWVREPDIIEEIPLEDVEYCQCSSPHCADAPNAESSDAATNPTGRGHEHTETAADPPQDDELAVLSKPAVKQISLVGTLKTVWPTLHAHDKLTLICGLGSSIVSAAANPVFSYCFAKLLAVLAASAGHKNESKEGIKWALVMVAMGLINSIGWGGSRYMLERVGQAWVNSIRTEALRRILLQPKAWFGRAKNSPGRITECLDRNAEEMRNLVGKFVPIMASVIVMGVTSMVWALAVSWKLTLVALAPCPVIIGAVKAFAMISGKWENKCNKGAEDASASATEIFLNIRVVTAFTLERHFTQRYESLVAKTLGLGLRKAGFVSPLYGLYQSSGFFLTALVFYYGTILLADKKELDVAEVMQVINLLLFGIGTATGLLISVPQLTIAQATASQMLGYANMPVDPPEGHRGTRKPETPLPVRMTDLGFVYSRISRARVLNGVSLDIQDGDCTATVGPSGCGKSTIISLILGLYHPLLPASRRTSLDSSSTPPAAPLSFGGVPSTDIDIQHLRSMMAYVPQAPYLFPTTISDNISYGLPEDSPYHSDDSIARAAEAAGIHDWVTSLPEGYNTLVGDGGQALSGGQAQRLCIARALVHQPRLLVLDEPTSALDAESAEIIRQTIRRVSRQGSAHGGKHDGNGGGKEPEQREAAMSIVMVTHSREMMAVADWIIMLGEGGNVVEEGQYADLWEEKGHFWKLVGENDYSWKE